MKKKLCKKKAKAVKQPSFKYGWCETDHKPGRVIRDQYRDIDYIQDEPYASLTKKMLQQLGLSLPKECEVFRGTHHDMLFLDSHGVVVRIGPTDVEDLMTPAILQPLGWSETTVDGVKHSAVIYPGIEHYTEFCPKSDSAKLVGGMCDILEETNHKTEDAGSERNQGIIRVKDDDKKDIAVLVLLDPDNEWIGSSSKNISNNMTSQFQTETKKERGHKGRAMETTLSQSFNKVNNIGLWKKAFKQHQPLRNLFWNAFKNVKSLEDKPDQAALSYFWNKCEKAVNTPTPILSYKRSNYTNDNGINVWKEERHLSDIALFRPWTGKESDHTATKTVIDHRQKPNKKKSGIHCFKIF